MGVPPPGLYDTFNNISTHPTSDIANRRSAAVRVARRSFISVQFGVDKIYQEAANKSKTVERIVSQGVKYAKGNYSLVNKFMVETWAN